MLDLLTEQQMKKFAAMRNHPELVTDEDRELFYQLARPASSLRELKSWEETAVKECSILLQQDDSIAHILEFPCDQIRASNLKSRNNFITAARDLLTIRIQTYKNSHPEEAQEIDAFIREKADLMY